ncbi:MAG TPA: hypothetical protein VLT33_03225 [Labilithrix sp.]|nr:hypothetical protein [Labilithrix sp.]
MRPIGMQNVAATLFVLVLAAVSLTLLERLPLALQFPLALFLPDRLPGHFSLGEAQSVPGGFVGQTLYPFRRAAAPRPGRSL